jgi:hypothetical protein
MIVYCCLLLVYTDLIHQIVIIGQKSVVIWIYVKEVEEEYIKYHMIIYNIVLTSNVISFSIDMDVTTIKSKILRAGDWVFLWEWLCDLMVSCWLLVILYAWHMMGYQLSNYFPHSGLIEWAWGSLYPLY